jgi:hypothetical protein
LHAGFTRRYRKHFKRKMRCTGFTPPQAAIPQK